jgi:hypothetical protein
MYRLIVTVCVGCSLAALFVVSGYMFAVVSFQEEVWVDCRSGARKTTCTLFPFTLSRDQERDGFRFFFGCSPDETADWDCVACRHFFPELDPSVTSEGDVLLFAEGRLMLSLLWTPEVRREADKLSKGFYDALDKGGATAANDYAQRLFDERFRKAKWKAGKSGFIEFE